mgnify:CR=1 FL=1
MINIKSVILSLLLLFPFTVSADSWKEWLKEDLYEEQFLEQTEDIIIGAPYRAIDGSNVPITISAKSKDIVKLTLIIFTVKYKILNWNIIDEYLVNLILWFILNNWYLNGQIK